jgi:hypothetical protein
LDAVSWFSQHHARVGGINQHRRYGASDPEGHEWYFATNLGNNSEKKPESRKKKR